MPRKWFSARYIVLLLAFAALFASCSNTKNLTGTQSLLAKNEVVVQQAEGLKKVRKNLETNLDLESKLASLARQQPNTKTLGIFRFNLWLYNRFYTTQDSGFNHFVMTKIGQPPVLFDSATMTSSAALMRNYLENKGYLFPVVKDTFVTRKKKTVAEYHIVPGPLYTIDSVYFPGDSSKLDVILKNNSGNSLLKHGNAFDVNDLQKEQDRLHKEFQDLGYFYFRKDLISFQADTNIGNHHVNVYVNAREIDTSMEQVQYQVRNIYLYPDFNQTNDIDTVHYDTLLYEGMRFLTTRHYVDPDVLATAVYMVQGALFSRSSYECTLNRIYDLNIYKFANARFVDVGNRQLDCFIYLTPTKKHQVSAEAEVGNVEDNFASGVRLTYQSRNVFHRANTINFSALGGVQIPVLPKFNTDSIFYNVSGRLDYTLPKFAIPFLKTRISCFNDPVTRISLSANYFQQTNYYSLKNFGLTYSLEWKEVEFPLKKFIVPILGINYVFPTYSGSFAERLAEDPFLSEAFSKEFIPSIGGAFIYSNQQIGRRSNFTYLRYDLETAGNLLYALGNTVLTLPRDSSNNSFSLLNVDFANYVRSELDVRRYLQFSQNRSLVLRFSPGVAVAYGNSRVVPYIKQFFLGGTSSMRAWRVRSLGPGTYRDTSNFYNSSGDLKLEMNAEYRFNIFSKLKGAAFVDAGNIWLLRNDPNKPGGTFYVDQFLRQIAVGAGLGARLDFTYFIIRLDVATPIYDPGITEGDPWAIRHFELAPDGRLFDDLAFQFAVGYPF